MTANQKKHSAVFIHICVYVLREVIISITSSKLFNHRVTQKFFYSCTFPWSKNALLPAVILLMSLKYCNKITWLLILVTIFVKCFKPAFLIETLWLIYTSNYHTEKLYINKLNTTTWHEIIFNWIMMMKHDVAELYSAKFKSNLS